MIIISHRANLQGTDKNRENNPSSIDECRTKGFDVEVDIWWHNGFYYLGHDFPQYRIDTNWLMQRKSWLWCHAKNDLALKNLLEDKMHCFWHDKDRFTLTSRGIVWCYPGNYIENSIAVLPESFNCQSFKKNNLMGICTDFPYNYV